MESNLLLILEPALVASGAGFSTPNGRVNWSSIRVELSDSTRPSTSAAWLLGSGAPHGYGFPRFCCWQTAGLATRKQWPPPTWRTLQIGIFSPVMKTMCPTLRLELLGTPRERDLAINAHEIAYRLSTEAERFKHLYNDDFYRAYMMAVFGTLQTFAMSDCAFISGDIILDLRVPFAGSITSAVQNVYGVSGSLKIVTHHSQYLQFSNLARIVNKDKSKPAIEMITYRTTNEDCRPLTLANLLRYHGVLRITAYFASAIDKSEERGSVAHEIFHEHDTTLHVEFKRDQYNLEKSGVAKTECANGVSPRNANFEQVCCPEECKGGCYYKGTELVCTHCKAPMFWSVDGKKCVSCEGQRRIDGYCLSDYTICPAPLVSISPTDCAFECPAGQTITKSLDLLLENKAKHAVCEPCEVSFDGNDFSEDAARACPKTCSHYGLLTLFNGLEGCQILIGKIIINQWTMGQRTTKQWHDKFLALLESFDSIYGDLIIHDLFNVVTFNYLAKLRRVEGALRFVNNDILRHVALNSIVPKGITKLEMIRNPQFNLHSRIEYFKRIAKATNYDFNLRPTSYQPFKESVQGLYKTFGAEYPTLDEVTCPANTMFPVVVKDKAEIDFYNKAIDEAVAELNQHHRGDKKLYLKYKLVLNERV
uniref:Receptor protein-tyrosine kinase n=1 Tax=Bursaphelenchus xylophilus TaxID=6326 RepID=A0A1I7SDJ8_BURXY